MPYKKSTMACSIPEMVSIYGNVVLSSRHLTHHFFSTTQWAERRTMNLANHYALISLQNGTAAEISITKHAEIVMKSRMRALCAVWHMFLWLCSAKHFSLSLPEGM